MRDLYLLTSSDLPELCPDDKSLVRAFADFDVRAIPCIWSEISEVAKKDFLIRTPWDYPQRIGAFLEVIKRISDEGGRSFNSWEIVKWNHNKTYLQELEQRGILIVPTHFCEHFNPSHVSEAFAKFKAALVVKPTVSASGQDTFALSEKDLRAKDYRDKLKCLEGRQVMIQPFMDIIQTVGEYSFMFFGGEFSHAILKSPSRGEFRVQKHYGGVEQAYTPQEWEVNCLKSYIEKCPYDFSYVRVDVIIDEKCLYVMEIEAIEPELFFGHTQGGEERFCQVIEQLLSQ